MRFPLERFLSESTPFYYYDLGLLCRTLECIRRALGGINARVHYAIKANANPIVLAPIVSAGLGADCVSGGEIHAAINAGFAPESIVYAGVGKTDAEIVTALDARIGCFNVESAAELRVINDIASSLGLTAHVALRINPNIDAHTHKFITTGLSENKFGIDLRLLDPVIDLALSLPAIRLTGMHMHIGSQITVMEPYILLCDRVNDLYRHFLSRGVTLASVNVGGGLGIDYDTPDRHPIPDFETYFTTFRRHLHLPDDVEVHFELGRAITAQCGSLITRVIYVKEGVDKRFAIVDAGMNDLLRPALYGARHHIQNLSNPNGPHMLYDVVGPVCETSDRFGESCSLPHTRRGDILAIRSAGAYGESMAMTYNCRPLPRSIS